MQTELSPEFQGTREGAEAEAILRKCVHCGFCTATCPTYQLLGDELDGPRGRIYLIKQVLEGAAPTRSTQAHLDRCLTCRNCESTCPSGVEYARLLDIGRRIVDERVSRPVGERMVRGLLKEGLTSPLFAPAFKAGQAIRPLLPQALKDKVPSRSARPRRWPTRTHARKVLLLAGCVQPAMAPNINAATARVLDAVGIQTVIAPDAGCCGAIRSHMGDHEHGLAHMRRNIDAWWPLLAQGEIDTILVNASGCSVTVKDYGHALAHDEAYAQKAARVAAAARDVTELLPQLAEALKSRVRPGPPRRVVFHPPCTLQHGQRLRGLVETHLTALGFEVSLASEEGHLCCGSAGTYSVLQAELSRHLRDRKLANLEAAEPQAIVSANVGCIQHLQSGTKTPVRHWIEMIDEALDLEPPRT
jgi:glycolate oxidase iron-sulfur subunit